MLRISPGSASVGLIAAAALEWPPSDPKGRGVHLCFDEKQGLTFENCCNQEIYGPWGNPECLKDQFSYELCCLPDWTTHYEIPNCDWVEFCVRTQEISGEDPEVPIAIAQNDKIQQEGCCGAYEADHRMCWNHVSFLRELLPASNISSGYATCCFDHFQALVDAQRRGEADPLWLQKELEVELPQNPPHVRQEDLSRVFHQRSDVLCRIRLVKKELQVEPSSCLGNGRVKAFYTALQIFQFRGVLPSKLDLLITIRDVLTEDFGVPVFTDIRPASMAAGRLIRYPHEFLLGVWGRKMTYRVRGALMRYPWNFKEDVLLWRGGMTGRWICPHDESLGDCKTHELNRNQWNLTHWHLGLRGRAILLQSFAPPGYTDIKFTTGVGMSDEVKALFIERGWLDLNEPPMLEKQFGAKYLLVTDDSDRIFWMATGNSLMFLPSSGMLRGCGLLAMQPWRHFIPLKPDLSDALERIAWAKAHDEEARLIAARGAALAREAFSHEAQLFCLLRMLQEVSAWLQD